MNWRPGSARKTGPKSPKKAGTTPPPQRNARHVQNPETLTIKGVGIPSQVERVPIQDMGVSFQGIGVFFQGVVVPF